MKNNATSPQPPEPTRDDIFNEKGSLDRALLEREFEKARDIAKQYCDKFLLSGEHLLLASIAIRIGSRTKKDDDHAQALWEAGMRRLGLSTSVVAAYAIRLAYMYMDQGRHQQAYVSLKLARTWVRDEYRLEYHDAVNTYEAYKSIHAPSAQDLWL